MSVTSAALRFAVIGSPIAHSRSPRMHAAAYRALGMPHTYEAIGTTAEELPARVDALRRGELAGLNVTIPHKTRVLGLLDELDESARATGAANTLVRLPDGRVRAHNTDMPAVAGELARLAGGGSTLRGGVGLVIGTGGAARAAIVALALQLGMRRVLVRGRALADVERAAAFVSELEAVLARAGEPAASVSLEAAGLDALCDESAALAAIVQATSCGMTGAPPGELVADVVRWDEVPRDAVALDVVYAPPRTPFLDRARARGLRCDNGLGMLARQGALAFELWLGGPAPLAIMRAAIEDSAA